MTPYAKGQIINPCHEENVSVHLDDRCTQDLDLAIISGDGIVVDLRQL